MSTGNPLEQLRRRMQSHATPTAFAALAEEHRRAGRFAEAIAVCRDGLERYPAYASARVTLGRALLDSGDVRTAVAELEQAVAQSPDNLAAAKALDAAHLACAALPPLPPAPTLDDLEIRIADDETASIPVDLIAQALGSGADSPQEFGLAPDWSLPPVPDGPALAAPVDATAATDATDTLVLYPHAESPTIGFTPPHLQGEEPAGIWPVPSSSDTDADAPTDGARVYSWAILPPGGTAPATDERAVAAPPTAGVWDAPTIDAPLVDLSGLLAIPTPDLDADVHPEIDALAGFGSERDAEPSLTPVHEVTSPAAVASLEAPGLAPAGIDESSPFWGGLFGGESDDEAPAAFAGWGTNTPPTDGADRAPWAEEAATDPSGAWNVPDGPSATWALGDLHEAAGADATPFRNVRDDAPPAPAPFASLTEPEPLAPAEDLVVATLPDLVVAAPPDTAWAGSVKSALGEVFALAGHGDSLEPPTHRSPAVRRAMADAALEATLEDVAMRGDTVPPALASLQQMLDAVRARRAALFSHPDA
ncbi:tetratricopeptide repeat protein [Luteitalea sp.]|uniref:tetratricopeptide repeat protein n=1 Tax=Luteitalea sp. TaxID=2004800 RepID=UPI0025C13D36|nr:tetratricopeptide repeat protein [Luteitalea sp.]